MNEMISILDAHSVQWSVTSVPGVGYTAWIVVPNNSGVWSSDGESPVEAIQNALDPLFRHTRQVGYEFDGASEVVALQKALGSLSPR